MAFLIFMLFGAVLLYSTFGLLFMLSVAGAGKGQERTRL
jgi:hypothetical protein